MIGAEEGGLPLDEPPADALEQRIRGVEEPGPAEPRRPVAGLVDQGGRVDLRDGRRHMAGESLEDGGHAQGALAREDLALEGDVTLDPGVGERAAQAVDVPHPSPREIGRADEELGDLGLAEAEVPQHQLPDRLLSRDGEWGVDPLERHPVNHPLPVVPAPPRHGVGKGAVVEEVADAVAGAGRTLAGTAGRVPR